MTDRLPPNNLDAEQAFIGSLLTDRDAIAEVADWVTPDAFYHGANGTIYRAMLALWRVRRPCDLVTLGDLLLSRAKLDEIGGHAYLAHLLTVVPTAIHAAHYGEIVMAHATRRAVIDAAAEIVRSAYQGDVEMDDLTSGMRRAGEAFARPPKDGAGTFAAGMEPHRNLTLSRWDGSLEEHIVPTGVASIDRKTYGGFKAGELIVIGARPGMGKTSIALQMAKAAASTGKLALVVELEMSREALFNRAVAAEAGVPFGVAYQRMGDPWHRDAWLAASERLESIPLAVETKLTTTDQIAGYCERAVSANPVGAIFIDHLDHLSDRVRGDSAEQRTAELIRRCSQLAKRIEVPVIVLAQLNRAVEEHPPFKPALTHFKYSGAIEAEADYALMLYRRKYYVDKGLLESDPIADYLVGSNRHRVELMIAKHRNGEVGAIELGWVPEQMRFVERDAA